MKYRTVQTMMLPDCAEENYGLYYQGTGGIQVQQGEKKSLSVPENEKADLFTYFNGFYPKQWKRWKQNLMSLEARFRIMNMRFKIKEESSMAI